MKQTTAIYTLTSALHDEKAVSAVTQEFLGSIGIEYVLKGNDYSDYGTGILSLIYVRTGGTEGLFKQLLPGLQAKSSQPFYLLTSGKSNSLAASMEILSYLRQHDIRVRGTKHPRCNRVRRTGIQTGSAYRAGSLQHGYQS